VSGLRTTAPEYGWYFNTRKCYVGIIIPTYDV
jgi:hypothetical protein